MRWAPAPKYLTLCAVGALLFLVSVPRVHQLAVQDNERDALSAIRALAQEAFSSGLSASPTSEELSASLSSRLKDVRFDPTSKVIRRHGYLFEVVRGEPGSEFARAWPARFGETGANAFILRPDGAIMIHSNETAGWSGFSSRRPTGAESGWAPIPKGR